MLFSCSLVKSTVEVAEATNVWFLSYLLTASRGKEVSAGVDMRGRRACGRRSGAKPEPGQSHGPGLEGNRPCTVPSPLPFHRSRQVPPLLGLDEVLGNKVMTSPPAPAWPRPSEPLPSLRIRSRRRTASGVSPSSHLPVPHSLTGTTGREAV